MERIAQRPSASKAEPAEQDYKESVAIATSSDPESSQALPGARTTATEAFDKAFEKVLPEEKIPSLVEQVVRAWAKETQESAPPRHHLDYALHVEDCLGQLIEQLEGLK